jgi:hypothetical protein
MMRLIAILAAYFAVTQGFCPSFSAQGRHTTTSLNVGDNQPLYGGELDMPESYVRCGRCQTLYALKEEDLGGGKGR